MTSHCDGITKTANVIDKSFTAPESSKTSNKASSQTQALSTSSFFTKKGAVEEPLEYKDEKLEETRTTKLEKAVDVKSKSKDAKEVKTVEETKKIKAVDQVTFNRPSNPFAKSSSKQENTSLFDSLKNMKKADIKGKT